MREGDDDELRQLIEHLKCFVQDNFPASPFSNFICHPEKTSFAQILAAPRPGPVSSINSVTVLTDPAVRNAALASSHIDSSTPSILEEGDELSWAEAGDEEIWQPVQQTEEERAAKVAAWQQAQVTLQQRPEMISV